MRLTRKLKPPYKGVGGEDYFYACATGSAPSFAKVEQKLGRLEDIEEICLKLQTQPLYEKHHGIIYEEDYTKYNVYYDFVSDSIVIYDYEYITEYPMKNYGITWALTKEELK